jgi:hypothetical protein
VFKSSLCKFVRGQDILKEPTANKVKPLTFWAETRMPKGRPAFKETFDINNLHNDLFFGMLLRRKKLRLFGL